MQRLTARFLLLFALAGTFVPLTLAAVAPPPHSCCLRKAAHHCHGAETADRSIRNTSCCNHGSVRGIIHDPQHRPVENAMVMLKAKSSDWSTTANSDANGNFTFNAVPMGEYIVSVAAVGFDQTLQNVTILSGSQPVLHFALKVAGAKESVNVSGAPESAPTDSSTPTTVIDRVEIARTP